MQVPGIDVVGSEPCRGPQAVRRGGRGRRDGGGQQGPMEGGEDLVGQAGAVEHRPWPCQQGAVPALAGDALGLKSVGDVGVAGEGVGLEAAVQEDGAGPGLTNQPSQFGLAVAASQDQARAECAQRGVQRAQGLVQPPEGGSAHWSGRALVKDIDRDDRAAGLNSMGQGRIVRQPQIPAEPEYHRGVVGLGGHAVGLRDSLRTSSSDAT